MLCNTLKRLEKVHVLINTHNNNIVPNYMYTSWRYLITSPLRPNKRKACGNQCYIQTVNLTSLDYTEELLTW